MITDDVTSLIKANLEEVTSLREIRILKDDNSYVSKGDLLLESLVKDMIKNKYPEYALISEESPDDNLSAFDAEKVIILDPIDGTENFVSGLKEWGVSFCVYEYGKCVESLLALPELNQYITHESKIQRYKSRIAGISSSLTKEDIMNLKDGFEYRIIGCCVYNMFQVVSGAFYSFENPKGAKVWDIIAGMNLAIQHGLKVTVNNQRYYGELLRPDQKYIFRIEQN